MDSYNSFTKKFFLILILTEKHQEFYICSKEQSNGTFIIFNMDFYNNKKSLSAGNNKRLTAAVKEGILEDE